MGLKDIVQQLKGARTTLVGDRDRIDAEIGRLDTAIAALDGADGTKVQTIAAAGLNKVTRATTPPKVAPASGRPTSSERMPIANPNRGAA